MTCRERPSRGGCGHGGTRLPPGARVLVAPAAFKGTLSATAAAAAIAAGLRDRRPDLDVEVVPVADGGSGTVAAAVAAGFEQLTCTATGPLGKSVDAAFAIRGDTAVVELAAASGLALVGHQPDPLAATSRGTGELITAALAHGARHVVLGVGDSACTDGGAGMLAGLGARFVDGEGRLLADGGGPLRLLDAVDLSGLAVPASVVLASDVDNPLLGRDGAAATYGPQKGASPADVAVLEAGLETLVRVLGAAVPGDPTTPGAGAGGGVGFAALAALGAVRRPGVEVVLELTGFADRLRGADLVVTGEGRLDDQSLRGKAPVGVLRAARSAGVPTIAIAGRVVGAGWRAARFQAAYEVGAYPSATDALAAGAARIADELTSP